MFMTMAQSRPCECGGKSAHTPSIRQKHLETKKHRGWRWRTLCETFLDPTLPRDAKIAMLRELKTLVAFVD